MKLVKQNLGKWIIATIIFVCGILCIVAGAALKDGSFGTGQDALDAISLILGITFIVVGSLSVLLAGFLALTTKKGFMTIALPGAIVLALGISLVVDRYVGELLIILVTIIPYLLIAIGAVLLLEATFGCIKAGRAKKIKSVLVSVIVLAVVGLTAVILGALCVGDNPVIDVNVQLIVFGIMVMIEGLVQFLLTFFKLPDAIVTVVSIEE